MNTGRRRSAKGKWQDAMFPVKGPTYAGSMVGATPRLAGYTKKMPVPLFPSSCFYYSSSSSHHPCQTHTTPIPISGLKM